LHLLYTGMTLPIANRNDDQYSSDMNTEPTTLELVPSYSTAVARHEDDTICAHPALCGKTRTVYFFGGRPGHPDNLGE